MKSIDKLCNLKNAFELNDERDQLFVEAMKENYEFQLKKQDYIKHLAKKENVNLSKIKTMEDVKNIPHLFVGTMKYHGFCSVEKEELEMVLTSSGTKGQKTQSFFDKPSMRRLTELALETFDSIGYKSNQEAHYFVMGYDISKATDVGTSWSDNQMMSLAPAKSKCWTIEWDEEKNEYKFDVEKWAKLFVEKAKDAPIRLLGFPAYMYGLVEEVRKNYGKLKLKEGSWILAGGGWKNHLGKTMTLRDFADYMEENIGIGIANIGDTYGMAEHGVPYCSCKEGNYHIPVYSRVVVRNPLTLEEMDMGEEGLGELITPYNTAQSNLSVLSTDLITISENCACGLSGKYIKSIRRGGVKKHKGCAIKAQEILQKSKGGNQ